MMHLKVRATPTTTATSSMSGRGRGGDDTGRAELITPPPPGGLLRTPMATLMERVTERRVILRSLETAAKERAAAAEAADPGVDREDAGKKSAGGGAEDVGRGGGGGGGGKGQVGAGGGALWVDKYAPEGFRDLLSDEKINREVLRAVKAWDPFVFKKEVRLLLRFTGGFRDGDGGASSCVAEVVGLSCGTFVM